MHRRTYPMLFCHQQKRNNLRPRRYIVTHINKGSSQSRNLSSLDSINKSRIVNEGESNFALIVGHCVHHVGCFVVHASNYTIFDAVPILGATLLTVTLPGRGSDGLADIGGQRCASLPPGLRSTDDRGS